MNNSGQYRPPIKPQPKVTAVTGAISLKGGHVLNAKTGAASAVKRNANLGVNSIGR